MKAPEKIHIQPNAHDGWFEGKIPNGLPNGLFVEYTRSDAFIEKACKWLEDKLYDYAGEDDKRNIVPFDSSVFEDFRKAMEE